MKIYFCVVGKYKIEKAKLITFLWKIHCFYQDYRYTYIIIVTRNGKIVWKHGPYCSCIRLNSRYLGVAVQSIHQNSEKWWFCWGIALWKWLWGCFSQFLLLWLWCQRFWGSSEDCWRPKRLSKMLLVYYSLLSSQDISINNSEERLVIYLLGYLWQS